MHCFYIIVHNSQFKDMRYMKKKKLKEQLHNMVNNYDNKLVFT